MENKFDSLVDDKGGAFSPEDGNRYKTIIASYLYISACVCIIASVYFWPAVTQVTSERRLLLLVAIFGALGSLVHALRSFSLHTVMQHEWGTSWLLRFLLLPLLGATIAVVFYAVMRAGFISLEGNPGQKFPWLMAAIAALVGMFHEAAASKLKDVAYAVLKTPPDRIKEVREGITSKEVQKVENNERKKSNKKSEEN